MKRFVALLAAFASLSLAAAAAPSFGASSHAARPDSALVSADTAAAESARAKSDSAAAYVPPPPPDQSSLDVRVFRFLNGRVANPVFDAVMPVVTDLDRWRVLILLAWAALVIFGRTKGRWAALVLIPLIAASDQLSSTVLKPLVERMRPCEVLGGVHLWYGPEGWITTPAVIARSYKSSFSFPSSHAANITASMLFLGLVYRRLLVPLVAVAALVGFSRIYIGVHWPSDVLGGAALGAALACMAYVAFRKVHQRERETASAAPPDQNPPPASAVER